MSHCLCSQTDPSAPIGGYRGPPSEAGGITHSQAAPGTLASARKASSEARHRSLASEVTSAIGQPLTLELLLQRDFEMQRVREQERVEWRMQLERERQERTKEREEDRAMMSGWLEKMNQELLNNQVVCDVLCSARAWDVVVMMLLCMSVHDE